MTLLPPYLCQRLAMTKSRGCRCCGRRSAPASANAVCRRGPMSDGGQRRPQRLCADPAPGPGRAIGWLLTPLLSDGLCAIQGALAARQLRFRSRRDCDGLAATILRGTAPRLAWLMPDFTTPPDVLDALPPAVARHRRQDANNAGNRRDHGRPWYNAHAAPRRWPASNPDVAVHHWFSRESFGVRNGADPRQRAVIASLIQARFAGFGTPLLELTGLQLATGKIRHVAAGGMLKARRTCETLMANIFPAGGHRHRKVFFW